MRNRAVMAALFLVLIVGVIDSAKAAKLGPIEAAVCRSPGGLFGIFVADPSHHVNLPFPVAKYNRRGHIAGQEPRACERVGGRPASPQRDAFPRFKRSE